MRLQAAGRHFIEWHFIKQQCFECTSHYLLAYVVSSLTNYKACVDFFSLELRSTIVPGLSPISSSQLMVLNPIFLANYRSGWSWKQLLRVALI